MFMNEIVQEVDVNKYNLDELIAKFDPWYWRDGRPSTFTHSWTINREINTFLVKVSSFEEVGFSGRAEPTNKDLFVLNFDGVEYQVIIKRLAISSSNFNDSPFNIFWKILEISPQCSSKASEDELLNLIMDALIVYGHRGALRQVPNTVVKFIKAEN